MDLKGELEAYGRLVDRELSRYIDRDVEELYAPIRDLMSRGGKRIRPVMCMVSCEAVGGEKEDALKAATAIEMVHNFTLIHDDIADRSELRRGDACLHRKYGLGPAINAGDGMFSVAYEAMADAVGEMDKQRGDRTFKTLAETVTAVSEGQAMDIAWVERKRWDLSEEDYFGMIRRKTGALMAGSCAIGGIIGGGSEEQVGALREYGMNLGVGFQIHDDVLNLRGDVKKYGKEICGDINEGKRTLIIIYTLSVCTGEEKRILTNILDKERNPSGEIKTALEIINKYGSVERAEDLAEELVMKGKDGLGVLPESEARELLIKIVDYIVQREV